MLGVWNVGFPTEKCRKLPFACGLPKGMAGRCNENFRSKVGLQILIWVVSEGFAGFLDGQNSINPERAEVLAQFTPTREQPAVCKCPNGQWSYPAGAQIVPLILILEQQNLGFPNGPAHHLGDWRGAPVSPACKQGRSLKFALVRVWQRGLQLRSNFSSG